jgi:hypothetical protein
MAILLDESPLSLAQAAALFPSFRAGRPVHSATLTRWILRGVRGPNGSLVRLEAVRRPAGWLTSRESVQRFLVRLTPQLNPEEVPAGRGCRSDSASAADRELVRDGF